MAEESGRRDPSARWWTVAISLALHLMAVFALGLLPTKKTLSPPLEQSIAVEILTEPSMSTSSAPERKSLPDPSSASVEETQKEVGEETVESAKAAPEIGGMVRPKELFSAKVLADPRSKAALVALRQLAVDDRIIQLCNVEVMEQVHRWNPGYQPDFVVAYAISDTKLSGLTLNADGGALRSKQHWYNVKFRCEVTPDLEKAVAFEFAVGSEIPESEWETHSLPIGDGASD